MSDSTNLKKAFKMLPIESLERGQFQPRKSFDQSSLEELAQSIRTQGLIEPIIVREKDEGRFEIIAGERRWRAAMLAQLSSLPCIIANYDNQQTAAITLIENIQRENLNVLEEAQAYQRLLDEFQFQQEALAQLVGKSRSHIANLLRLLSLCPYVHQAILKGLLSLGHARMLVGLDKEQQILLTKKIAQHHWSVRKLEQEVRQAKASINLNTQQNESLRDIEHLQSLLAEQLGAPVNITLNQEQGGWLNIKFYDNDTLAGLLERFGLSSD